MWFSLCVKFFGFFTSLTVTYWRADWYFLVPNHWKQLKNCSGRNLRHRPGNANEKIRTFYHIHPNCVRGKKHLQWLEIAAFERSLFVLVIRLNENKTRLTASLKLFCEQWASCSCLITYLTTMSTPLCHMTRNVCISYGCHQQKFSLKLQWALLDSGFCSSCDWESEHKNTRQLGLLWSVLDDLKMVDGCT